MQKESSETNTLFSWIPKTKVVKITAVKCSRDLWFGVIDFRVMIGSFDFLRKVLACFFLFFAVETFDLANHLNVPPELLDRVYNRPTLQTLETKSIKGAVEPGSIKVELLYNVLVL